MTTDHACHWAGSDRPRMMTGRHVDGCDPDHCRGCQPCNVPLCRVCGTKHVDGTDTCPGCVGEVRDTLAEILRMCAALPKEVEHRGVDGEAFALLGPVADAEAWGHRQASAAAGRIDQAWLEQSDDERHPLIVLGTWLMVWQDALEHESDELVTVENAAEYLAKQLTYMAGYEHVPFEDFARDLRQCVGHLEAVLHDGEQVDEGVPCMDCGRRLRRYWGEAGREDGWECKRCRKRSTETQYRFAVQADYLAKADRLPAADVAERIGVPASTVRRWAGKTREQINGEWVEVKARLKSVGLDHNKRKVYNVADAEALRDKLTTDEVA